MNIFLLMSYSNRRGWQIVSAHGSETLAFAAADKFLGSMPKFRKYDKWKREPLPFHARDVPGEPVRAWKNTRSRLSELDARTLTVVRLEVEGNILDQLAAV